MGKVVNATYRFLMNRRLPVLGTYTEQARYSPEDKEGAKVVEERKSKIHGIGGRRRKGHP